MPGGLKIASQEERIKIHSDALHFEDEIKNFNNAEYAAFLNDAEEMGGVITDGTNRKLNVEMFALDGLSVTAPQGRIQPFIRAWYLYNNMSVEDILSNSPEVLQRKSDLNKKFFEEFKLPSIDELFDDAEAAAYDEMLDEKRKSNFIKFAHIAEACNEKVPLELIDLNAEISSENIFEDFKKKQILGNININVSQVFQTKGKYDNVVKEVFATNDIKAPTATKAASSSSAMTAQVEALLRIFKSDRFVDKSAETQMTSTSDGNLLNGMIYMLSDDAVDLSPIMGKSISKIPPEAAGMLTPIVSGQAIEVTGNYDSKSLFDAVVWGDNIEYKLTPEGERYKEAQANGVIRERQPNEVSVYDMTKTDRVFLESVLGKSLSLTKEKEFKELSDIYINGKPLSEMALDTVEEPKPNGIDRYRELADITREIIDKYHGGEKESLTEQLSILEKALKDGEPGSDIKFEDFAENLLFAAGNNLQNYFKDYVEHKSITMPSASYIDEYKESFSINPQNAERAEIIASKLKDKGNKKVATLLAEVLTDEDIEKAAEFEDFTKTVLDPRLGEDLGVAAALLKDHVEKRHDIDKILKGKSEIDVSRNTREVEKAKLFESKAADILKGALDVNSTLTAMVKDEKGDFVPLITPYAVDLNREGRGRTLEEKINESKSAADCINKYDKAIKDDTYTIKTEELDSLSSNDIMSRLTGVEIKEGSPIELYKIAASKVYINGVSALNYYQIPEEAGIEEYRNLGNKISDTLRKGMEGNTSEFVMLGDGVEFKPVTLELSMAEPEKVERFSSVKRAFSRKATIEENERRAAEYEANKALYDKKSSAVNKNNMNAQRMAKDLSESMASLGNKKLTIDGKEGPVKKSLADIVKAQQKQKTAAELAPRESRSQPVREDAAPDISQNGRGL